MFFLLISPFSSCLFFSSLLALMLILLQAIQDTTFTARKSVRHYKDHCDSKHTVCLPVPSPSPLLSLFYSHYVSLAALAAGPLTDFLSELLSSPSGVGFWLNKVVAEGYTLPLLPPPSSLLPPPSSLLPPPSSLLPPPSYVLLSLLSLLSLLPPIPPIRFSYSSFLSSKGPGPRILFFGLGCNLLISSILIYFYPRFHLPDLDTHLPDIAQDDYESNSNLEKPRKPKNAKRSTKVKHH